MSGRSVFISEADKERERCIQIVLEQRCERGTPWDLAIVTAARALGSKVALPTRRYKVTYERILHEWS